MSLPNDKMMLLSVVNTKLRDYYNTLDEMCEDMNENREDIVSKLNSIGYEYDEKLNRFI